MSAKHSHLVFSESCRAANNIFALGTPILWCDFEGKTHATAESSRCDHLSWVGKQTRDLRKRKRTNEYLATSKQRCEGDQACVINHMGFFVLCRGAKPRRGFTWGWVHPFYGLWRCLALMNKKHTNRKNWGLTHMATTVESLGDQTEKQSTIWVFLPGFRHMVYQKQALSMVLKSVCGVLSRTWIVCVHACVFKL